jgi:eukaryotic-like serine/threonine-protein kinase
MSTATPDTPGPSPLPPALLANRYRLERRLAQGGMAEVWVGTDTLLSRQVAIKLLKPALAADPVIAERFRREAVLVAQLSHPNIVAVYDTIADTIGGERRQAVVMQLVNGKSLRQLLDEQKKLSPDLTIHIGACVAAALDAAHHAGLVHRDVKPGNILITSDGRVLLTDFGIAKGVAGDSSDDLTSSNVMMGTAKYLSPEQVRGKRLDGRADLYSLGLVLYECLAGRVPFLGESDADTALARLNRDPTDLTVLRPTLPPGLAKVIHRLLARRPTERYATGSDVRAELGRVATRSREQNVVAPADADTRVNSTRSTGRVPAVQRTPPGGQPRTGRPVGQAVRLDRTPPSARPPQARQNRKFEPQQRSSSIVVGILLLAAVVVGLILWWAVGEDGDGGFSPPTSAAAPIGSAGIVAVTTYDPDGSDGVENDELVGLAHDGDPGTAWTTVCYRDRYLGGKGGVGLVADLGAPATGTFAVSIASGPYQVQVTSAATDVVPASFSEWQLVQKANNAVAGDVSVTIEQPARYVLVSFNELAPDPGCGENPYRGAIAELSFAPG